MSCEIRCIHINILWNTVLIGVHVSSFLHINAIPMYWLHNHQPPPFFCCFVLSRVTHVKMWRTVRGGEHTNPATPARAWAGDSYGPSQPREHCRPEDLCFFRRIFPLFCGGFCALGGGAWIFYGSFPLHFRAIADGRTGIPCWTATGRTLHYCPHTPVRRQY